MLVGITIAVFAAMLAITDIAARHYAGDELIANNEKATAYQWYQAKVVRETVAEAHAQTMNALIDTGAVSREGLSAVEVLAASAAADVERYRREKNEILLGSRAVGEENWAQDFNGEMGQVVGANEWDQRARELGAVSGRFDRAVLLLQLAVVLGPVSLVSSTSIMRRAFFQASVAIGLFGLAGALLAFSSALRI